MTTGKELAKLDDYRALAVQERTIEMIHEALGGEDLTPFNMDRIVVPTGGNTIWMVPTLEGKKPQEVLTGIILHDQYYRGYWKVPYGEGEAGPPDCFSWEINGRGTGDPGGDCYSCSFNQYNSHPDTKRGAKGCSEKRYLFLLRPDRTLPVVVQAAPTSLRALRDFRLKLADEQNRKVSEIVVDLKLVSQKRGGYDTAIISPSVNAYLSEAACKEVEGFIEKLSPLFAGMAQRMAQDSDDYLND